MVKSKIKSRKKSKIKSRKKSKIKSRKRKSSNRIFKSPSITRKRRFRRNLRNAGMILPASREQLFSAFRNLSKKRSNSLYSSGINLKKLNLKTRKIRKRKN